MSELDGIRIIGPGDGEVTTGRQSTLRELISAGETGNRWAFGEVTAEPDESAATHLHPGEAEAIVILEGEIELHGSHGVAWLRPGDVIFIPPDTEHGLRTPHGVDGSRCGRRLHASQVGDTPAEPRRISDGKGLALVTFVLHTGYGACRMTHGVSPSGPWLAWGLTTRCQAQRAVIARAAQGAS